MGKELSARPARRAFCIAARGLVVIVVLVILGEMILPSMKRASWSSRNDYRIPQLRTLYAALLEYKEKNGAWPPDLEAVKDAYAKLLPKLGELAAREPQEVGEAHMDYVGFPPLTGPHRVEYLRPPAGGNVILRSYGHSATRGGCTDRPVAVTMDVTTDGKVTLGGAAVTAFTGIGQR